MYLEKEFDASSTYLYKAVSTGQTLKSAELRWYRINDAGKEEVYFTMLLEDVKITGVMPSMPNIKSDDSRANHIESVTLMYERITWHYADGNLKFTDAWNER